MSTSRQEQRGGGGAARGRADGDRAAGREVTGERRQPHARRGRRPTTERHRPLAESKDEPGQAAKGTDGGVGGREDQECPGHAAEQSPAGVALP
jgi:hypothetical protein